MDLLKAIWQTLFDKGIGSLATPWQIEREGKARTDVRRQELLQLAQTEIDIGRLNRGEAKLLSNGELMELIPVPTEIILTDDRSGRIEPTLSLEMMASNANRKISTDAIIKEINLNKTIILAEEELLKSNADPHDKKIDDDWLYKWRNYAETVSEAGFQLLWAKILAGEAISPGSFSARTLHLLHNFSQKEAEQVAFLADYAIGNCIYKTEITKIVFPFEMLLHFEDIGIISSVTDEMSQQINNMATDCFKSNLHQGEQIIVINHPSPTVRLMLPCYRITHMGQELIKLCDKRAAPDNLVIIGRNIKSLGFEVSIGKCCPSTDSTVTISHLRPI